MSVKKAYLAWSIKKKDRKLRMRDILPTIIKTRNLKSLIVKTQIQIFQMKVDFWLKANLPSIYQTL